MITPQQALEIIKGQRLINPTNEMVEFILNAPSRLLQEFILISRDAGTEIAFNGHWLDQAKIALQARIGEETIVATNGVIKQLSTQTDVLVAESRRLATLTEQLTNQTATHIEHTRTLTQQTDRLIAESVGLGKLTNKLCWLTWALIAAASVQIVIMVFDHIQHK